MSDDHLQEPAPQPQLDDETAISEGVVHDVGIGILGAAGWDGLKAASHYAIDRWRDSGEPVEGQPPWLRQGDDIVDLTVDGDWDWPIDFNDFDS